MIRSTTATRASGIPKLALGPIRQLPFPKGFRIDVLPLTTQPQSEKILWRDGGYVVSHDHDPVRERFSHDHDPGRRGISHDLDPPLVGAIVSA